MVSGITTIRMQLKLKRELDNLKVIDREPYESVIKRLIDCFKENLDLSEDTQKLISERINMVEEGKVMSTKELHRKLMENKRKKNFKDGL